MIKNRLQEVKSDEKQAEVEFKKTKFDLKENEDGLKKITKKIKKIKAEMIKKEEGKKKIGNLQQEQEELTGQLLTEKEEVDKFTQ